MKGKNMNKKIDYIIEKEEIKYYPIIQKSIKSSHFYNSGKIDKKRLNSELTIIHKMKMSRFIYYLL